MLLKETFAIPLLKHRREGGEKSDNYTANCKAFCVTRKRKYQFIYCPLFWMFCLRRSSSLVNNAHERALRIVYDDHNTS